MAVKMLNASAHPWGTSTGTAPLQRVVARMQQISMGAVLRMMNAKEMEPMMGGAEMSFTTMVMKIEGTPHTVVPLEGQRRSINLGNLQPTTN